MPSLTLRFLSTADAVVLTSTSFFHPDLPDEQAAFCDCSAIAPADAQSFHYNNAVRGFALLVVQAAALERRLPRCAPPVAAQLDKSTEILTSALADALGTDAKWLLCVFGTDRTGQPLARKILSRFLLAAPEAQETTITVNSRELPLSELRIVVDGNELSDPLLLEKLAESIRSQQYDPTIKSSLASARQRSVQFFGPDDDFVSPALLPAPFNDPAWHEYLKSVFRTEIGAMLKDGAIFSKSQLTSTIRQIVSNPLFQRVSGHCDSIVSELDLKLQPTEGLGVRADDPAIRRELNGTSLLRIALDGASLGAMAIFYFLKHVRGFNFKFDYRYGSSTEIVTKILNNEFEELPDACVLSVPAAASLLKQRGKIEYAPLMLLPRTSHRVVARTSAGETSLNLGRYLLISDQPGSSHFYFDALERAGKLSRSKVTVAYCTPEEAAKELRTEDPELRAILFSPNYYFACLSGEVSPVDPTHNPASMVDHILFVHNSLLKNQPRLLALDVAIRDAWLKISSSDEALRLVVQFLSQDSGYLDFLIQVTGLDGLSSFPTPDEERVYSLMA